MRTSKKILLMIGLATSLILMGCTEENKTGESNPISGPYMPPGSETSLTAPGDHWNYGATAGFVLDGADYGEQVSKLSSYAGQAIANPTDLKINLNLTKRGVGFGGRVSISYFDDGKYHEGRFVNGDKYYFANTSEEAAARYNIWYEAADGNIYFHGFFQDLQGGLVIVIDDFESNGDGAPPVNASGTVWYKNFSAVPGVSGPLPPTHCWYVSIGPYDCRAWKAGNEVDSTRAVNPDAGYIKLGRFNGLNIEKALNGAEIN
ncbi:hypothetical protein N9W41_00210 [bacterium]|nr:hypothetical protein [bacterium]